MKDITDLSMGDSRLKILQSDILSQALDESSDEPGYYDSLYDLYRKVVLTSSAYDVITKSYMMHNKMQSNTGYIHQEINNNSNDNYYVPTKVDQMQKIIYSSSNINIFKKTIPMLVLYAEDNSYARLSGLIDKRFYIVSIEINGITAMRTSIQQKQNQSINDDDLGDAVVYRCSVYIDPEYVCNLYNEITCIIRGEDKIQQYRIYRDMKFVSCKIRYIVRNSSDILINKYQDMIKKKIATNKNCAIQSVDVQGDCAIADMSEYYIGLTGFTAENDCITYKLIQDRKTKGLPIYYDCTKHCCYKSKPRNS